RKSGRLVENKDLLILVDEHLRKHLGIAAVADGAHGGGSAALVVDGERRHSDQLSGLHPRIRLRAATIHPHLAGTQQLLQLSETEARIMDLEPAVEPHTGLATI